MGAIERRMAIERMYAETQDELKRPRTDWGWWGFIFRVMEEDEYRALSRSRGAVERLFHELARERLAQWIERAEMRLKETGTKCFVMGGNDDAPDILQVLYEAKSESMIVCEDRVTILDKVAGSPHTMISLGYSTPTPWHTPRVNLRRGIGQTD